MAFHHRTLFCLASLVVTALASAQEPEDLFADASFDAFTKRGGSGSYAFDGNALVGTSAGYPNSFLCTKQTYGDFELEVEFKVDDALNSGIQIRSETNGKGKVFGYQVEIDPSPRSWTAGIYDESRRGWINDLADNEAARKAFVHADWNSLRVVCEGPRLRTWINGIAAADLLDVATLSGFVAFQVHGMPKSAPPSQVRWRRARITGHGKHVWQPMFDGKSLSGFEPVGGGSWTVEDGILVGRHASDDRRHGVLLHDDGVDDFAVRIVYRVVSGNSGLYFRCEPTPDQAVVVRGFQAEIDVAKEAGMLYETGGRARVAVPSPDWVDKHFKPGDWNEMVVIARGRHIKVLVNGAVASEVRDDPGRLDGRLGIQLHGSQDVHLEIRSLERLIKSTVVTAAEQARGR